MIGDVMLESKADTSGFIAYALDRIRDEQDDDSRAMMYYLLYEVYNATDPAQVRRLGHSLLADSVGAAWIYNQIGYGFAEKGVELDLAVELTARAIDLAAGAEDSASYLDSRGWAYFKQGRYEAALEDLKHAARLIPEPSEEILRHLGRTAMVLGKAGLAMDTFKTVLVMGEYQYAWEVLDSLAAERGLSGAEREELRSDVHAARIAASSPAAPFELKALDGSTHSYDPRTGEVTLINVMTPT
jgi:tetratricopeptide (TPR) repeat protein